MINEADINILKYISRKNKLNWADLIHCLQIYNKERFNLEKIYTPTCIKHLTTLIASNYPDWETINLNDHHLHHKQLPSYVIDFCQSILTFRRQGNSIRTRIGLTTSALIMTTINAALNHHHHKSNPSNGNRDATKRYDQNGFLACAEDRLKEMISDIKSAYINPTRFRSEIQSAMELITACQYILNNTDAISRKKKLTTLTTPPEFNNVPFHAEKANSDKTRKEFLTAIVNKVIEIHQHYNNNKDLKTFYDLTYGGNCIEGRTRRMFETYDNRKYPKEKAHETLEKKAIALLNRMIAVNKLPSKMGMTSHLSFLCGRSFPTDDYLCTSGILTQDMINKFIDEALIYHRRFFFLDLEDNTNSDTNKDAPGITNNPVIKGVTLFQAGIRGNLQRQKTIDTIRQSEKEHKTLMACIKRQRQGWEPPTTNNPFNCVIC